MSMMSILVVGMIWIGGCSTEVEETAINLEGISETLKKELELKTGKEITQMNDEDLHKLESIRLEYQIEENEIDKSKDIKVMSKLSSLNELYIQNETNVCKCDIFESLKENEFVIDRTIDDEVIELIEKYVQAINQQDIETLKQMYVDDNVIDYDLSKNLMDKNISYLLVGAINPYIDGNDHLVVNVIMNHVDSKEIESVGIYFDPSSQFKILSVD